MNKKNGPYQVIECEGNGLVEKPVLAPLRDFDCSHYEHCLNLSAALNWDNFTCRGCVGEMNESLIWQARQAQRKDLIAKKICSLPVIELHEGAAPAPKVAKIVGKR